MFISSRLYPLPVLSPMLPKISEDLDHVSQMDIQKSEELINDSTSAELWDHFLKGQARLYINYDSQWLSQQSWWCAAKDVLEIGCGNGCYLSLLAESFPDKRFKGVDNDAKYVEQAAADYMDRGIAFQIGNAQETMPENEGCYDIVIYRFTLQWLTNPLKALELAHGYLKPGGMILIVDSYDAVRESTRPIEVLESAASQLAEINRSTAKGNRLISMQILKQLKDESSSLSLSYRVKYTSLEVGGTRRERGVCFENKRDLGIYLNQNLLFLGILRKKGGFVDFPSARRELEAYDEEGFQISPGIHYLVLQKI